MIELPNIFMHAEIVEIDNTALLFCFAILIIPLALSYFFKFRIIAESVIAVIRMTLQLFLVGFLLIYLFEWDNIFLNILWFVIMMVFASFSVVRSSGLRFKLFILPTLISLMTAGFFVVLYFNAVILGLENILQAKYFIVISGMLIGNSMRGIIVGLNDFYKNIKRNEERYLYSLSQGATLFEGILPYFRSSMLSAMRPTIAAMATIGIVFLPGMMTGQILGGAMPDTAVKYQIAIMTSIFTSVSIAVCMTILFTVKFSFNEFGILKKEIFRD